MKRIQLCFFVLKRLLFSSPGNNDILRNILSVLGVVGSELFTGPTHAVTREAKAQVLEVLVVPNQGGTVERECQEEEGDGGPVASHGVPRAGQGGGHIDSPEVEREARDERGVRGKHQFRVASGKMTSSVHGAA